MCSRTGRHLATFTRPPGSSLYTLTIASAQVAAAGQVAASSQVSAFGQLAATCSCQVLSHQTLLLHHRLGHPSLPRLRGMHSRLLVSGLPRSLPSLPRSPALPCLPCVEGRQRAAPHSSEFPLTTAPLQTLHMDVWGPAPVGGTDQERYFLLVVDDYTRYTTVFPLQRKADSDTLRISSTSGPGSLSQRPRPHSGGRGQVGDASVFRIWGALSLVRDAKANKLSSCTLRCVFLGFPTDAPPWELYSPRSHRFFSSQDVTFDESVCYYRLHPHASHPVLLAPLFLVPVPPSVDPLPLQGPAPSGESQVDLPPVVEPLEISSDSSGLAEGGDPAADDTAATCRSPRLETPPGFPPRPSSPPPQPAAVDYGVETAGAESRGAEPEGEGSGGAGSGGATSGGAGSWGAATGGADSGGPASPNCGGAVGDPAGGLGAGQPLQPDLLETLSPQAICAWIVWRGIPGGGGYGPAGAGAASPRGTAGAGGTGGTAGAGGIGGTAGARGAASAGGTRGAAGAGVAEATSPRGATGAAGAGPTSPGGATGAAGTGGAGGTTGARGPRTAGASGAASAGGAGGAAGAAGAGGAGAAGAGGAGAAGTTLRIPFFYPQPQSSLLPPDLVLRQFLSLPSSIGLPLPLLCPPTDQSQPQLLPGSPLPALDPHTEVTESLTERREPETRASTPDSARRVARPRPPAVPGTHGMALRPSSVPQRVVLPESPASSLPHVSDPESELARAASPTDTRLLATVVTDPDLESTAAFALVTKLVDFAARSHLDYVATLVTECDSVCPPSVGGELALGSDGDPDALDIPTLRSYAEAIAGEYSSPWQTAMDTEMASWKSTGTYVDEVPPPRANIVDGMWIFRVKRPSGSPPAFKARYVARGFSQQQGVDFFQTFSPTPKMTTLRVLLHVAAHRDYELHSLDFSTAFLQGSLHDEIWLRRPPGFTGSFAAGTQWSLRWPVYGLRQAPREWHDTLRTTLAALGFAPSFVDPSLFLRTDTTLPSFYVLVYGGRHRAAADTDLTPAPKPAAAAAAAVTAARGGAAGAAAVTESGTTSLLHSLRLANQ
ncbi:unnamed protein product [Closterium sp. NIES-53]